MIILEGPDGSGKSTLAKLAVGPVVHHGPPKKDENLFETYLRALLDASADTVFDRLFHGEAVYGPLFRGGSLLTAGQLAYLELVAASRGAIVVRCQAEPDLLRSRGDPIYNRCPPDALLNAYNNMWARSKLTFLEYNSTRELPPEVWQRINRYVLPDRVSRYGVGPADAAVALVGDKFSDGGQRPRRGSLDWEKPPYRYWRPFAGAASRDFLLEALWLCREYEPELLYLTNAYKDQLPTGRSRFVLREELADKRVVALGHEAAEELTKAGIRVDAQVRHPQHPKRFEYHTGLTRYASELREALWS